MQINQEERIGEQISSNAHPFYEPKWLTEKIILVMLYIPSPKGGTHLDSVQLFHSSHKNKSQKMASEFSQICEEC